MTLPPEIQKNIPLAKHTSWLVGGAAEFFFEPTSLDSWTKVQKWAEENKIPITILGGGTNVLISDSGIKGLVLGLSKLSIEKGDSLKEDKGKISFWISASAPKSELLKFFLKKKLAPACFLAGLPGQVGGGVVMNAGVSENLNPREFHQIVKAIEVLRPNGNLEIINGKNLNWKYRHCEGWRPGVITCVQIEWENIEVKDIGIQVKDLNQKRLAKQPLEWPSCGSVFRNPKEDPRAQNKSAGQLIQEAGLKGHTIGGAQISEKHGNFIINKGQAKASDIKKLIEYAQEKVLEAHGVKLQTEVVFLGDF